MRHPASVASAALGGTVAQAAAPLAMAMRVVPLRPPSVSSAPSPAAAASPALLPPPNRRGSPLSFSVPALFSAVVPLVISPTETSRLNAHTSHRFNSDAVARSESISCVLSHLRDVFRESIPTSQQPIELLVFGSCGNGFGSSTSDLDVCIMPPRHDVTSSIDYLKLVHRILIASSAIFSDIQGVFTARVPVVKCIHVPTGIECDLVLRNPLAVRNTALLRTYSKLDDRIPPLVRMVKDWASHHGILGAHSHFLSSYAWTILVLYYCQVRSLIPSLQDHALIAAFTESHRSASSSPSTAFSIPFVDDADFAMSWWSGQHRILSERGLTLADLFVGFLDYFAHRWDWTGGVVDIRGQSCLDTRSTRFSRPLRLCIRDPLELDHGGFGNLLYSVDWIILRFWLLQTYVAS